MKIVHLVLSNVYAGIEQHVNELFKFRAGIKNRCNYNMQ
jgi:hypothetical protein